MSIFEAETISWVSKQALVSLDLETLSKAIFGIIASITSSFEIWQMMWMGEDFSLLPFTVCFIICSLAIGQRILAGRNQDKKTLL